MKLNANDEPLTRSEIFVKYLSSTMKTQLVKCVLNVHQFLTVFSYGWRRTFRMDIDAFRLEEMFCDTITN